jgi:negative regulator of flagellin synthesis FlgM
MDVKNNLEGLSNLLGISQSDTLSLNRNRGPQTSSTDTGDRATLSSAASQVANSADDSSVRMDKVATIQSALAAGTYNIPASAVASKLVDSMLGNAA